jgi:cytochrome c-type biogenesis protein CcmF
VTVTRNGQAVTVLQPEKRQFPVRGMETTEAAISTGLLENLYVVIGEASPDQTGRAVHVIYHPLALWIWGGCGLMVLGGLVSLSDRRLRVGIPFRPARRPAAVAAQ